MLRTLLHCDSSSQERIAVEKADQEEEAAAVANRPVVPAVEHKQQETSVGMPATAIVTMKNCDIDIDVHDAPNATITTPTTDHPLERPTDLSLAKQEVSLVDALNIPSPTSPISKQVS